MQVESLLKVSDPHPVLIRSSRTQSMSERHSFERRSERRSFFRERKVSAALFRQKERKESAAQKIGERERKKRSF